MKNLELRCVTCKKNIYIYIFKKFSNKIDVKFFDANQNLDNSFGFNEPKS